MKEKETERASNILAKVVAVAIDRRSSLLDRFAQRRRRRHRRGGGRRHGTGSELLARKLHLLLLPRHDNNVV
jgi:hypothetical protein